MKTCSLGVDDCTIEAPHSHMSSQTVTNMPAVPAVNASSANGPVHLGWPELRKTVRAAAEMEEQSGRGISLQPDNKLKLQFENNTFGACPTYPAKDLDEANATIAKLKQQLLEWEHCYKNRIKALSNQVESRQMDIEAYKASGGSWQKAADDRAERIEQLTKILADLRQQAGKDKARIGELSVQVEDKRKLIANCHETIRSREVEIDTLRAENKDLSTQVNELIAYNERSAVIRRAKIVAGNSEPPAVDPELVKQTVRAVLSHPINEKNDSPYWNAMSKAMEFQDQVAELESKLAEVKADRNTILEDRRRLLEAMPRIFSRNVLQWLATATPDSIAEDKGWRVELCKLIDNFISVSDIQARC